MRSQNKYIDRIIPRGLNREESSMYIGISPSKFDGLVADGRMPKPKIIDSRRVWDKVQLDIAFDELPGGSDFVENPWDS
jgi:predicted DNA-binding transcriptional regulator AlpA